MKRLELTAIRRLAPWTTLGTLCLGAGLLVALPSASSSTAANSTNRYIGAKKCKSCHDSEEKGNQYGAWEAGPHAKAYEVLASDAAKKVAAERGIADPQKADVCVRCHTTAFGVAEDEIKRGFEVELGVQCEACHGPGDAHSKARFKAASSDDPNQKPEPGEVITSPPQATCLACHNADSPTFKGFCYHERVEEIRHSRPRTPEEKAAELVCGCGECACTDGCPDDGCGVPRGG